MIHAVKLYCAVANLYGVEYSVLHHRTPVARAEPVAVAPELHAAETVKNGGVKLYDANIGVVAYSCGVVKMLGVVELYI